MGQDRCPSLGRNWPGRVESKIISPRKDSFVSAISCRKKVAQHPVAKYYFPPRSKIISSGRVIFLPRLAQQSFAASPWDVGCGIPVAPRHSTNSGAAIIFQQFLSVEFRRVLGEFFACELHLGNMVVRARVRPIHGRVVSPVPYPIKTRVSHLFPFFPCWLTGTTLS